MHGRLSLSKLMSHLLQQHISAPQSSRSLLSPHHGDAFIELIFGGGWCILGETALENSLQSNKLVDRKHEIYRHPLLVSNE